jgi:DNA repair protein RecN (Recombination protein N)
MLNELVVEGLGVIEVAELSLDRGCSALTGETGAGKTLLVAALSLLLGGRADRTLVRTEAGEARVEGRFSVPPDHRAVAQLVANGIIDGPAQDDGEIEFVIARTLPSDGRSGKSRINGRLVTVSLLAEIGSSLAEIAGQHEHQRLGAPSRQRALLDAFAGPVATELAERVADAVALAAHAERRATELRATERDRRRELDVLHYEIAEIEKAGVEIGEAARLAIAARRLENAESIASAIAAATGALRSERGADELVAEAAIALRGASSEAPELGALAERLEAAGYELADVADDLARRAVAPDPDALDEVRARQSVLTRLQRKYGEDESEVLAYLERVRARAGEIEAGDDELETAEGDAARLRREADELARELSELRSAAVPEMTRAVVESLEDLAMGGARFEIVIEPRDLYEGGIESVEFLVSANPGEVPRPVTKVASGGELSRIALALHLLTSSSEADTLVFDEVDAGVGGRVAQSVGKALADIAGSTAGQVLVVTHLPQVAAFADRHYRIDKTGGGGRTTAVVEEVTGDERIAELSRMLAGLPKSERAREHAQELLDLARSGAA